MSDDIKTTTTEVKNETSSYRSIFKATSLFGGVQIYQILIGIISSKIVAIMIGPLGVGIKGMLQSTISLIRGVTSLGLSRSAVRDVAVANGANDNYRIGRVVVALRKLVWFTGFLGMGVTILLSPILSKISFGNYDYTIPFIILSVTLLLDQLTDGQMVLLQGMRKLKYLAKASAIGVTIGLLVSIPVYYFYGLKGIVPTILIHAIASLILSLYFARKISFKKVKITNAEAFQEGRTMMKMGVVMSISSVLSLLFAYLLRSFIRYRGGIEAVGIFTAGFAIVSTYVGMIFDAMIKDFYPRLSAVSKDNTQTRVMVNQQIEIGMYLMTPMIVCCMVFMPIIIWLLYSDKFEGAIDYVLWSLPGMVFKLLSWAVSLIFVAKGASKLYMTNELLGNLFSFVLSLLGYYLGGMMGLGIGFSLGFVLYLAKVFWTANKEYSFSFSRSVILLCIISLFMVFLGLVTVSLFHGPWKYIIGSILLAVALYFSLKEMNKKMGIIQYVHERLSYRK